MTQIELHIFANSTVNSPSTSHIERAYNSFCLIFGNVAPTIWIDPHPNTKHADEYIANVKCCFGNASVNVTESLSDGYMRAIKASTAEFMFMLEHDWIFTNLITHTLDDIVQTMESSHLIHFRFNKRRNVVSGWDLQLNQHEFCLPRGDNIYYCTTPSLSNNPHVIHRPRYINTVLNRIKLKKGSKGIEENLRFGVDEQPLGAIYGKVGYPPTIQHLDGRHEIPIKQ